MLIRYEENKMRYTNQFYELLKMFIEGTLSGPEFEEKYILLWNEARDSSELSLINKQTEDALDELFTAVDVYCSDETLRDDDDLDEDQLLEVAKQAFKKLEIIALDVAHH